MNLPLVTGEFTSATPGGRPVRWAATGRLGGASKAPWSELNLADHVGDDPDSVERNRQSLAAELGLKAISYLNAEHGARVHSVDQPQVLSPGDACITGELSLGLAALGADCATVGVAGTSHIAVVHCGWRGLVAGVLPAAFNELAQIDPGPFTGVIGPHICANCYPVGREVWDAVSGSAPMAAVSAHERLQIDLRAGIVEQTKPWDVQWTMVGGCTFEVDDLFSYRRDGVTGRHGLVIWRT